MSRALDMLMKLSVHVHALKTFKENICKYVEVEFECVQWLSRKCYIKSDKMSKLQAHTVQVFIYHKIVFS